MTRWSHIPRARRTGLVNLAIAGAVAVLIWFSWWLWRDPPQAPPPQRDLTEVTVTWKCAKGHVYQAPGAYGIGTCRVCGAKAYILVRYRCSVHGEMQALLWHEPHPAGGSKIAGIDFGDQQWVLSPAELRCPQCGRKLRTVGPNLYRTEAKDKGG